MQGSTGEAILLSDQERRDVLKAAMEAAVPHKVMIAGTGIESASETLRLTEYAASLGYDAAMVRTPHYYRSQINKPRNMLAFYRTVADHSPLPLIIYNFPQATGYDMPVDIVIAIGGAPEHHCHQGIQRLRREGADDGGAHAAHQARRHRHRSPGSGNRTDEEGRRGIIIGKVCRLRGNHRPPPWP